MNQRIPFLEELKRDLVEHAPQKTRRAPLRSGFQLRGAWAAAAAFLMVLVIGGLTWMVGGDTTPNTTVDEPITQPGPELTWRQVAVPDGISTVRDLWSHPGGFAIWTGEEIWTSADAETWELVASDPPTTNTNIENAVAYSDNRWLVAGADESGAPLAATTSDGSTWITAALPTPSPSKELLTNRVEIVGVTSGPNGFVAAGHVATGVDEEAAIERYAPDLNDGEIRYRDDSIDILESDGTVRLSVPYKDIDQRLAAHRGAITDTIIWHSPDGQSWSQVDLIEDTGPGYLGAHSDGYTLTLAERNSLEQRLSPRTLVLTSSGGADWDVLAELQEPVSGITAFAIFGEDLIVGGQDVSVLRVSPEGTTQAVSTGPAFEGTDLGDLTISRVAAGEYGVVAAAFNHSIGDTPYQALWYSPDGQRWNRQDTSAIFGNDGNLQAAVGSGQVVVATDPQGEAGLALNAPFDLWTGTTDN